MTIAIPPRREPRVLRLTPFFHHADVAAWPARYDPVGGQQTQCLVQSQWLARRGVDQIVLTLGFPGVPARYTACPGLEVRRARYPWPEWRSATTGLVGLTPNWYWATRAICRRLRRDPHARPDIVHVHGDGQIEAMKLVPWARRLFGRPVVLTLHCSRLMSYRPMSRLDGLRNARAQAAERRAVACADAVICLNAETTRGLGAAIPAARATTRTLADVIDLDTFRRVAKSEQAHDATARHMPKGGCVLAFVGRIAHEKGWPDLLSLLRLPIARDWQALFVGDGPQRADLERAVARSGLGRRVHVTGFLPRESVAGLIAASNVVVMPSVHEEFGGVAIEAMTLGTPVAGYAVGGLRHTIGRAHPSLLAPPGDVAALAEIVAAILGGAPWVMEAIARGRRVAEETCDVDRVLPQLLDLYRELAAR